LEVLKPAATAVNERRSELVGFYLGLFLVGFSRQRVGAAGRIGALHFPHLPYASRVHFRAAFRARAARTPWFNFGTIAAFLAWFGGTGYLLEHYYHVWVVIVVAVGHARGLGAASWSSVLAKVLMADDIPLDPADYDMVGAWAAPPFRSVPAAPANWCLRKAEPPRGGCPQREGAAIPKGIEVIFTRYEKGMPMWRPFEDALGEEESRVFRRTRPGFVQRRNAEFYDSQSSAPDRRRLCTGDPCSSWP